MKFKTQAISTCIIGLILGGCISIARADESTDWLPSVICKENKVFVVFTKQNFYMKVNNIFCTYSDELVKL